MTATSNHIGISYKFQRLWQDIPQRYVLLTGGRGSGKSHAVSTWTCDALRRYPDWRVLFTRYTLTSAEISIIPEFEQKLDLLQVRDQFDVTKRRIVNRNTGSDIIFSGIKTSSGNQTAKLKSIPKLNIFEIDEAEEFHSDDDAAENAFDTIDFSIRAQGVPNRIIMVMNPATTTHWIWRRWFDGHTRYVNIDGVPVALSTHPDLLHIHTTYLDNISNLSGAFLHEVERLREANPDKYGHVIIGSWRERAEGVIFSNWIEGAFDTSLPYCYGMDDGYTDPLTLVKVAVDPTRRLIYMKEILYRPKLGTSQVLNLMGIVERRNDLIVADSENPRLIDDIAAAGYNITGVTKGPGSVVDGLRRMQDYTLVIDRESHNLKRELNNYVWSDRKAEIPVDAYNHAIDAGRYAFSRLAAGRDVLAHN